VRLPFRDAEGSALVGDAGGVSHRWVDLTVSKGKVRKPNQQVTHNVVGGEVQLKGGLVGYHVVVGRVELGLESLEAGATKRQVENKRGNGK
jgi:hypothetical protein